MTDSTSDRADQPVCLCFGVSRRKVEAFLRVQRPRRASQLAECGGAGTGCGWCVTYLRRLFEHSDATLPAAAEYAAGRDAHRGQGDGPP